MSPSIEDIELPDYYSCKTIKDLYDWYEPTGEALKTEKGVVAEKLRLALELCGQLEDTYRVSIERMLVDPDYKDTIIALLMRNKFNIRLVDLFGEDKQETIQKNTSTDQLEADTIFFLLQDYDVDAIEGLRLIHSLLQFVANNKELEEEIRIIIGHVRNIPKEQKQKKLAIERYLVTELINILFRFIEKGATIEFAQKDVARYAEMIESFSEESKQIFKEAAEMLIEELAD